MIMTTLLIVLAVLIVLILITLKMGLNKKETGGGDEREPIIHVSGIYSILRESPRDGLAKLRPSETDIRKYLFDINEDINGVRLVSSDREALVKHWKAQMELNLLEIEKGDKTGVVFYYYNHSSPCSACIGFITKGNFVTREEIYKNPQIIPPFHLGCTFELKAHHGADQLRETTTAGMAPFFEDETPPPLPEWTCTVSLSARAEAKK